MSWSLHLRNGDLNPSGPGGLAQVTGSQKLVQDLRCALLTPIGTDPLHLDFGSTLDGGTGPDGSIIPSAIGSVIDTNTILYIESEIRRVLTGYQEQQVNRLLADQATLGGKNTFAQGEILYSIDNVNVQQIGDVVVASAALTTSDGDSITLTNPVSA